MTNLSKQQIKFLITCGVELCAVYGFCCQLGNELEQVSILGIGENKVQPLRVLKKFGKKKNIMAFTMAEFAWDIPYLNGKICLFHYQIFTY
jgi:hypothetical protein